MMHTNKRLPTTFIQSLILENLILESLSWVIDLPDFIVFVDEISINRYIRQPLLSSYYPSFFLHSNIKYKYI